VHTVWGAAAAYVSFVRPRLGIALLSQAADWRSAVIPAVGLVTVGLMANLAFIVGHDDFAPKSLIGWAVASTPTLSLLVGAAVLAAKPRMAEK
jgi:hypothetical protein